VLSFFATPRLATAADPFPQLTPREREILEMIAQGLDNAVIARRLVLTEKSVRNRVSDILTKLRARSRAEAVVLARDAGLGGEQASRRTIHNRE
jgi:DNA-binding NarL/FixJ family response regulator